MDTGSSGLEKKASGTRLGLDDQPGIEVYHPPPAANSTDVAPEVYWSDDATGGSAVYTFYREGTPTPPEYPGDQEKRLGERPVPSTAFRLRSSTESC